MNLVVIVADTWREPGLPGEPTFDQLMPFLATARREAVDMGPFLASSPWTMPSHLSLLAGLDPWEVSLSPDRSNYEFPKRRSLADRWHELGGVSALFSANEMVSVGNRTATGYDHEFPAGWRKLDRFASSRAAGLNERLMGRATRPAENGGRGSALESLLPAFEFLGYGLHRYHRRALDGRHVERALGSYLRAPHARPLHLLLNLMETHEPYVPPAFPGPSLVANGFFPAPNMSLFNTYLSGLPGAYAGFRRAYFEAARRLDQHLERIFGLLQRAGAWKDSVVVLVSDHGQGLGEHRFFGHGYEVYDELVRVPCLAWNLGRSASGRLGMPGQGWIDHRHLHDFLLEAGTASAGGVDPSWREMSLSKRGPATSYYEGTLSRPTPFSRPTWSTAKRDSGRDRAQVRRIVRACAGAHSVVFGEGPRQGEAYPETSASSDDALGDLTTFAQELLRKAAGRSSRSPGSPDAPPDVEERLKGWGYV